IAQSVEALHRQGVWHKDLKPANVLIEDPSGRPRLLDFGLAAMSWPWDESGLEGNDDPTSGTLPYMATEQARGETDRIGPRTDVFGLGAILYETLTGRPPYRGPDRVSLIEQARAGRIVRPRLVRPGVP